MAAAAAMVLAPIVMVHFVVLMLPLRIAHAATVDDNNLDSDRDCRASVTASSQPGSSRPSHVGVSDRAGGPPKEAGALTDAVAVVADRPQPKGEEEEEEEKSKPSTVPFPAPDCDRPKGNAKISSPVPGDVVRGNPDDCNGAAGGSSEVLEGGADGLPAAIRWDLARPELGIRR